MLEQQNISYFHYFVSLLSPRHSVTVAGTRPHLWARSEHSVSVTNKVRQVIHC